MNSGESRFGGLAARFCRRAFWVCSILLAATESSDGQGKVSFTNYNWYSLTNPQLFLGTNGNSISLTNAYFLVGPVTSPVSNGFTAINWESILAIRTWDSSYSSWFSFGPFNPTPGAPPALFLSSAVA